MGKNLIKKLGVWEKDKVVRKDNKIYAKDYYCVRCYEKKKKIPAVALYPLWDIDQDTKFKPYCKKCLDDLKFRMMVTLFETPI
jgi:hypothetical protein